MQERTAMSVAAVQAAAVVLVAGGGLLIGASFTPGAWYAALQKPWFTPAPWVFGPVWAVLYVLIGWVGGRVFLRGGPVGLWLAQMALNFLWSPVFFGLQRPEAGLAVIAALWLAVAAFVAVAWRRDRVSAVLFLPYLAWVTLAGSVNAGVVALN
jgi:tryptophan-rich sensory protein